MTSQPGAPQGEGSPYSGHIPALDGVRGLAIFAVMGTHLFYGTPHGVVTVALQKCLEFGAHGVDLFFVLSGFLITGILYESRKEDGFFRKFYARRVLRIFPIYYAVLAGYAIASVALHLHFGRFLLALALYLQNTHWITMPIYSYHGQPPLPLFHFWTLAVEEHFYLVWPFVVFWLKRRRPLLLFSAVVLVLCPVLRLVTKHYGMSYEDQHANTFCRMDSLLAGAVLAITFRSRWHNAILRYAEAMLLAGLALSLIPMVLKYPVGSGLEGFLSAEDTALEYTWLALASAGLIACVLKHGPGRRVFSASPLRWTGRYSYGIYVLHVPLFAYLQTPLHHFFSRMLPSKGAVVGFTGMTCAGLAMVLAWCSYRFFEVRFLRLKRFFAYQRAASAG